MITHLFRAQYLKSKYTIFSTLLLSSVALSEYKVSEHQTSDAQLSTYKSSINPISSTKNSWALTDLPPVDCIISPHQVIDLSSAVPGVIREVHKERSEFVEKGQIVAKLTSDVEKAAVVLAKARAKIQSELEVGRVNLIFAQRQQDRIDSLHTKAAVSYQHKDEADRELELSQWEFQRAKDLVNIRNLELSKAQQELKQKTVISPITGFVIKEFKSAGEYVEDQPIMRIAQLDPLKIEAIMPMALFGHVQPGMSANIQLESMNFGIQEAQVTLVDKVGDAGSGTFGIRLSLPNPDYKIPAGLKCDLQFTAPSTLTTDNTVTIDKPNQGSKEKWQTPLAGIN